MTEHAILGASSSHRWMACPGSVRMAEPFPDTSSEYAAEGTVAHKLAEQHLNGDDMIPVGVTVSQDGFEITVTREMHDAVYMYTGYCLGLDADRQWIEQRVTLEAIDPPAPMFGTADFIALYEDGDETVLEIVDLKYGRGVVVEVENNTQLAYYALGAALHIGGEAPDRVRMTVVQPRASHPDGKIRTWEVDFDYLIDFKQELFAAAEATQDPNAPLNPGDHCLFCKAQATCPAQLELAQEVALSSFDAYVPPPPESLATPDLLKVLRVSKNLKAWLGAVEEHAIQAMERGEEIPGFKLVEGRSNRQWVDEEAADKYLAGKGLKVNDRYSKKLISPNQATKALRAAGQLSSARKLDKLITKPEGKPTLAPVSDKREALPPSAIAAFAEAVDEGTS